MSPLRLIPALLFTLGCLHAAEPAVPPELRGILVTGRQPQFALVSSGGDHSGWAALGQVFDGWTLLEFVPTNQAIVLGRGERKATVALNASVTTDNSQGDSATPSLKQADDLLGKMQFEAMWDRIAEEQKKAIRGGMRQQVTAELGKQGLAPEEMETLLDKMSEALVAELRSDAMRTDFARIYTEVYTKEELRGMADFYDTTAGKAWIAKQPEVQQKLMQAMMPRVMQGMPAAQKVAADYVRQRATKAGTESTGVRDAGH
jgi:hypothetical protein